MSGATGTQQTGKYPPADTCPDPTDPHIAYQVDAAAAKEEAVLYAADVTVVDKAFVALDGAQGRYAAAKAERATAFKELRAAVARIEENLDCILEQKVRDRLTECWTDLLDDSGPVQPDCAEVDALACDALPADIAELRALDVAAARCVAQVDAEFTTYADLPKALGIRITALSTRAMTLEQQVGSRNDPERRFVEFLQLERDFQLLDADWIDPADYWCRLKVLFVRLLHRHGVLICVRVAVLRWDKRKALEDQAQGAKVNNLVDLVLECSRRPAPGASNGSAQQNGPTHEPDSAAKSTAAATC